MSERIRFSAYADDYTVDGEVELESERLADFLDRTHDIEVENVTVRALDNARVHRLPSAVIRREELCVIAATGPRGRADRRIRTRSYPMRAAVGPYLVVGYFHALPTAEPLALIQRRQIMALSPARLVFIVAGERVEQEHDALLLIRSKVEELEHASDEEVGLSKAVQVATNLDPRADSGLGVIRAG